MFQILYNNEQNTFFDLVPSTVGFPIPSKERVEVCFVMISMLIQ